jgi:hypothetical protein
MRSCPAEGKLVAGAGEMEAIFEMRQIFRRKTGEKPVKHVTG